jgi:hypothetical protein
VKIVSHLENPRFGSVSWISLGASGCDEIGDEKKELDDDFHRSSPGPKPDWPQNICRQSPKPDWPQNICRQSQKLIGVRFGLKTFSPGPKPDWPQNICRQSPKPDWPQNI